MLRRIIKWHYTGKGMVPGDRWVKKVTIGAFTRPIRGGAAALFSLHRPGLEKERTKAVFIADEDPNHGLVLNCYRLDKFERGDIKDPVASYAYFPGLKKAGRVNLAAMDIVYAGSNIKNM